MMGSSQLTAVGDEVAGRYRLIARLGSGAFAEVFRAEDRITREFVAIKLLSVPRSDERPLFRREVSAMRMLRLPGVVRLVDEGQHEGRPFLAMELIDGAPYPGLGVGRSWQDLETPTIALVEALSRIHGAGVVHRDLKPPNVLVEESGRLTLLDFGLAAGSAIDPEMTGDAAGVGTPRYCAPEQLRGTPPDFRSDLYSLGVMVHEALSGHVPHEHDDPGDFLAARSSERADPIRDRCSEVPDRIATLLSSLLQADPDRRPQSAAEVLSHISGNGQSGHGWQSSGIRAIRDLVQDVTGNEADAGSGRSSELELRPLFAGPDRLFHLQEDAAVELARRTDGSRERVIAEIDAWVRTGLAHWSGEKLAIERSSLERLRAGLRVVVPMDSTSVNELEEDDEELLALVAFTGVRCDPALLARITGTPLSAMESWIDRLVATNAVRRVGIDRLEPVVAPQPERVWSHDERQKVHHAIAHALPAGSEGRLFHLVACAELDAVADEALLCARTLLDEGRVAEAEVRLVESLLVLRSHGELEGELRLLEDLCKVAFATFTPVALDRALYELSRARPTLSTTHLEALVRSGVSAMGTDGERALALANAVEPFEDSLLDRWRQAMRVYAAGNCSFRHEEEILEQLEGWVKERGDGEAEATRSEALGRFLYRQERFEEAAIHHARAAELHSRTTARLSAMTNCASALLEALEPARARVLASEAREIAERCRHPYFECRSEWLQRAAGYRLKEDSRPDLELVHLTRLLSVPGLDAVVCMTEAAVAWRAGENEVARELAESSHLCFAERDWSWQAHLARALSCAAGEARHRDELAAVATQVGECPYPLLSAQILGLLAMAGMPQAPHWHAEFDRARSTVPVERHGIRMEVLATSELPKG